MTPPSNRSHFRLAVFVLALIGIFVALLIATASSADAQEREPRIRRGHNVETPPAGTPPWGTDIEIGTDEYEPMPLPQVRYDENGNLVVDDEPPKVKGRIIEVNPSGEGDRKPRKENLTANLCRIRGGGEYGPLKVNCEADADTQGTYIIRDADVHEVIKAWKGRPSETQLRNRIASWVTADQDDFDDVIDEISSEWEIKRDDNDTKSKKRWERNSDDSDDDSDEEDEPGFFRRLWRAIFG